MPLSFGSNAVLVPLLLSSRGLQNIISRRLSETEELRAGDPGHVKWGEAERTQNKQSPQGLDDSSDVGTRGSLRW